MLERCPECNQLRAHLPTCRLSQVAELRLSIRSQKPRPRFLIRSPKPINFPPLCSRCGGPANKTFPLKVEALPSGYSNADFDGAAIIRKSPSYFFLGPWSYFLRSGSVRIPLCNSCMRILDLGNMGVLLMLLLPLFGFGLLVFDVVTGALFGIPLLFTGFFMIAFSLSPYKYSRRKAFCLSVCRLYVIETNDYLYCFYKDTYREFAAKNQLLLEPTEPKQQLSR